MRKRSASLAFLRFCSGFLLFSAFLADQTVWPEELFYRCQDDVLKVKFSCHEHWQHQAEDEALLIIIQEDPAVTMTVARSKDKALFLEQLGEERLMELGRYGVGFTKEFIEVAGSKALKVDGFPEGAPDIRVRDYYIVHEGWLYMVLFSVAPSEVWLPVRPLVEEIMNSFMFI